MSKVWLTIDDSPSAHTEALTTALAAREIPALLFCRGDRLEQDLRSIVRAIGKGFVIGNHAYSHRRFSTLSFDDGVEEIERTERLIDRAYRAAGFERPGKYFRFPHLDRGCGGWVVDYAAAPAIHREALKTLFGDGLNIDLAPPDPALREKKRHLQDWLRAQGFAPPPFSGITHGWYTDTEMAQAADTLMTFSTADWMLTDRHRGKWKYKTLADLKEKIDDDRDLNRRDSGHVVLAHDQDGLLEAVLALLDHFLTRGFSFVGINGGQGRD